MEASLVNKMKLYLKNILKQKELGKWLKQKSTSLASARPRAQAPELKPQYHK
jgi:hypothetical protein